MTEPTPSEPAEAAEGADGSVAPSTGWSRRRRVLTGLGVALVVLIAGTAGFGVYAYNHFNANISTIEDTQDQTDRPQAIQPSAAAATTPLNILLIGSDSRAGDNGFVGGLAGPGLSDTTMLLHVSADRSRAYGVSIPRDSMVEMPSCKTNNGGTSTAGLRQFNSAYSLGGASCVRRTVEQLTDIRIDHYVVVDFAGFRDMVDALGGVRVYLPSAVNDIEHGISLPAGCNVLDGDKSLKYVRVRHIGGGSDIERLQRQQAFLSSVIQKVTSRGTLTNPVKLYSFLDAATKSLSADKELDSVKRLASLSQDLRSVGLDRIEFFTIPFEAYPPDPNRLQWTADADKVWRAMRNDNPLPGTGADSKAPPLVAAPATINVRVVDASGADRGADVSAQLEALGYRVVGVTTTANPRGATVVRWSVPRDESARTLAAATQAKVRQVDGLGQVVELVVGTDFTDATKVTIKSSASPSATIVTRTADTPICE